MSSLIEAPISVQGSRLTNEKNKNDDFLFDFKFRFISGIFS